MTQAFEKERTKKHSKRQKRREVRQDQRVLSQGQSHGGGFHRLNSFELSEYLSDRDSNLSKVNFFVHLKVT